MYFNYIYALALVSPFAVFFLFHGTEPTLPLTSRTIFKTSFRELPGDVAKMKIKTRNPWKKKI